MATQGESFQRPFGSREARIAYNEDWSRKLNQRRAEWIKGGGADFRCECSEAECTEEIALSAEDWTLARAKPNRFVVAPEHVDETVESIVQRSSDFWLIEKLGEAGEIAEQLETGAT
jgi:hypothetical protein